MRKYLNKFRLYRILRRYALYFYGGFLASFFNIYSLNYKECVAFNIKNIYEYLDTNNITLKYSTLVNGLDLKSKLIVDTLLFRKFKNSKIIFGSDLSDSELRQASRENYAYFKKINNNLAFCSNFYSYLYPGFQEYEIPVFKFHHGLNLFESKMQEYLNGKDCIDGGGFNFESAVIFSSHYPFRKVHSFEINIENIKKGMQITKNYYPHINNINSINKGLWNKETKMKIEGKSTLTKVLELTPKKGDSFAQLTTMDLFSNENKHPIGFIKLDVEGSEFNAIEGAKETILKYLPIISVSIYHNLNAFFEIKPLIESIAPGEYVFYIRKLAPHYRVMETYLICIPKKLNLNIINNSQDIDIYG